MGLLSVPVYHPIIYCQGQRQAFIFYTWRPIEPAGGHHVCTNQEVRRVPGIRNRAWAASELSRPVFSKDFPY